MKFIKIAGTKIRWAYRVNKKTGEVIVSIMTPGLGTKCVDIANVIEPNGVDEHTPDYYKPQTVGPEQEEEQEQQQTRQSPNFQIL